MNKLSSAEIRFIYMFMFLCMSVWVMRNETGQSILRSNFPEINEDAVKKHFIDLLQMAHCLMKILNMYILSFDLLLLGSNTLNSIIALPKPSPTPTLPCPALTLILGLGCALTCNSSLSVLSALSLSLSTTQVSHLLRQLHNPA